jgi:hypothetical protein
MKIVTTIFKISVETDLIAPRQILSDSFLLLADGIGFVLMTDNDTRIQLR